ncbi:MAG: GIY-YIG nuclease family protein [Endomicrobiia bacterium]|nr:GIY-YIG nuclease family protein [Endomicrobiia bacterium]
MKRPEDIPSKPGVYLMKDSAGRVIYVGKAKALNKRVASYFSRPSSDSKINILLSRISLVDYIVCASEREALILEDKLIKKLRPFYNTLLRDDKTYPFLKVSFSERFPSVSVWRAKAIAKNPRDKMFGPYPETPGLRRLAFRVNETFGLKMCRKIPSAETERKNCFYLQTAKCSAPCQEGETVPEDYVKSALRAARFLSKGLGDFRKTLGEEIKKYAANLEFEKAAASRDMFRTLEGMSASVRFREVNAKVYENLSSVTENLRKLRDNLGLMHFPSKIDCADISNIGASYAVGSVVRFTLGEPDKNLYRRYKIKNAEARGAGNIPPTLKQNDFAMMKEVVARRIARLKRESPDELPDLFVVDGGKGQLSAAAEALEREAAGAIDLISIAKGSVADEIFVRGAKESFAAADDETAFAVIRRARNEAHRFAVAYHRKLRDAVFVQGRQKQ